MKAVFDPEGVFAALKAVVPARQRTRRTAAENAANSAGQAKRRKRLQREAWERRRATSRLRRSAPRYGDRLQDRILLVMQPGAWHSTSDIMAAAGVTRRHNAMLWQRLQPAGMVESAKDPDGTAWLNGDVIRLWRLTRRGELDREALQLLA